MAGNAFEFYDYTLYGFLTPVLAPLFFPTDNATAQLLGYALFAAGFFLRPVGAILFGHFGDLYGRKKTLTLSLLLMMFPTFLIGLLPTYETIGVAAPIILGICRLIQGLCSGGEYNGAAIFVLEHTRPGETGFSGAFLTTSCVMGALAATGLGSIAVASFMPEWGWRIPFLLGLGAGIAGLYLRHHVDETPEFREAATQKVCTRMPLLEAFRKTPRAMLSAIGVGGVTGILYYIPFVYMNSYLQDVLDIEFSNVLLITSVGLLSYMIALPFMGAKADRLGEKTVMERAGVLALLGSLPLFLLLDLNILSVTVIIFVCLGILAAIFNGPSHSLMVHMFPVQERYSGVSFGFCLGISVFGGSAPFVATFLVDFLNATWAPAFYMMFAGLMAIATVRIAPSAAPRAVMGIAPPAL